jgi:hypothetical protein
MIFGFFMLAPRMHERYIYAAIVLAAPLAFESPLMTGMFVLLTLTGFAALQRGTIVLLCQRPHRRSRGLD